MEEKKINKKVYAIDFAIIVGSVVALMFVFGYARPLVIAPIDDMTSSNSSVLFSFNKAEVILIDDNMEFSSPEEIYVTDGIVVNLKPGHYYWKVKGVFESEIRELTIMSVVDLKIKQSGEKFDVMNAGNSELNVDVYNNGSFVESMTLNVGEFGTAEGDKFVGGQNG